MTTAKYSEKITCGPMPANLKQAVIVLRYSAGKAAKGQIEDSVELLQETFDDLVALTARGFLGARGISAVVGSPATGLVEVTLKGAHLPGDLVVIALRLTVGANDNSPEDFERLLAALDGDRDAALTIYGGTNFADEVEGITLVLDGDGADKAFDPFHVAGPDRKGACGALRQAGRLRLAGFAAHMPDEATEDLILDLAGMGAFLPLGAVADHAPGDEEYFADGDDLIIDGISIEETSLRALLAMLAPGVAPKVGQEV